MMVLASVYLSVSASLPTPSDIKPVEVWLLFNLGYPILVITSNIIQQVGTSGLASRDRKISHFRPWRSVC